LQDKNLLLILKSASVFVMKASNACW